MPRLRSGQGTAAVQLAAPIFLALLIACLYGGFGHVDVLLVLEVVVSAAAIPTFGSPMRAVYWTALALAAYEALSLFCSQFRANGVQVSWTIFLAVLVYFAVRLTIRTPTQRAILSGLLAVGGVWLAISAVNGFRDNAKTLQLAGLADPVAFRSRLIPAPPPFVVGEWLTIPLLLVPFACTLPMYLWLSGRTWFAAIACAAPLAIAAALSLSCSRAAFWGTVLFCVALCAGLAVFRLISIRASVKLLGSALVALFVVLVSENAAYPGLISAYAGQHTSQTRSTEGRVGIWKRTVDVVRAHPLWGVGSSNAALALTSSADQEETSGFASRAFSLPAQVLAEKGVVGFLLYAGFLVLVGREFIFTMQLKVPSVDKAMVCCFAAGLIAVLFRELTYSSVLEHTVTLALVMTLCALVTVCP